MATSFTSGMRPRSESTSRVPTRHIYSVSELSTKIKSLLEESFSFIWISGEISNFAKPASGHYYFTLKDQSAQIRAVMFRGQNRHLRFMPEDGMRVTGLGRISLYEPRGTYQVIFEHLEPKGVGELQIAFEQLKKKLAAEGLFDESHKQTLPFLPRQIAVVTSPTGAVIHDILRIINRRFANIEILVVPVKVQGKDADAQIAQAIDIVNSKTTAELAIVARGGGSLEDFAAFNTEAVARAIFNSRVPVISAVGHETDFTIADFVADLRAPTPSAAAEIVLPRKIDLQNRCTELHRSLAIGMQRYLRHQRQIVAEKAKRLVDPRRKIQDWQLRLDDLSQRLVRAMLNRSRLRREQLSGLTVRLHASGPQSRLETLNARIDYYTSSLRKSFCADLKSKRASIEGLTARLAGLNPQAVLARGYSITRTIAPSKVVTDARNVKAGHNLEITLSRGALAVEVKRSTPAIQPPESETITPPEN